MTPAMVAFALALLLWSYPSVRCVDTQTVQLRDKTPAYSLNAAVKIQTKPTTVSSEADLHRSAAMQLDACLLKYSAKVTLQAMDDSTSHDSTVGVFKKRDKVRDGSARGGGGGEGGGRTNDIRTDTITERGSVLEGPIPMPSLRQVGFTPLKVNDMKSAWTIEVETFDRQKLNLIFDSGSAMTIVNPGSYKPSYLSKRTGNKVGVEYMDGTSGGGQVMNEVWKIAGLTIPSNVVLSDTPVIAAEIADGVMGVGFTDTALAASLVEAMVSNYTLLYDSLSMTLNDQGDGALALGVLDASIVNEVEYTDVLTKTQHAWDVEASINSGSSFPAIIDTGTTYAFVPMAAAVKLFESLKLRTVSDSVAATKTLWGLVDDCSKVPEISLAIKGIRTKYKLNPSTVLAWTGSTCRLAIIGADVKQAVIGSTFLRSEC